MSTDYLTLLDQGYRTETQYLTSKFKEFLLGNQLDQLPRSVVLVLGSTGAGKSTTIGILQGAIYEEHSEHRYIRIDSKKLATPKTSNRYISTTLNIGVYDDKENNLIYIDTAGFKDNRGEEEKLWVQSNLDIFFSMVQEIRCILVVFDYQALFRKRGDGLKDLAIELCEAKVENILTHSVIFVITNAYEGTKKITLEDFSREAKKMLQDIKERIQVEKSRLEQKFPVGRLQKIGNLLYHGSTNTTSISLNVNNSIQEQDLVNWTQLIRTEQLLHVLIASETKMIISEPNGPKACGKFRKELLEILRHSPTIDEKELQKIRDRIPSHRLILQNQLSSLAASYLSELKTIAYFLTILVNYYTAKERELECIERDWILFKTSLIRKLQDAIMDKKAEQDSTKEKKKGLESSMKYVLYREDPVLKETSMGFLGLKYVFGHARVEAHYVYNELPFAKYDYDCDKIRYPFEPNVLIEDSKAGKLKINLQSYNGYNLNLTVRIWVNEKNHPNVKETIQQLGDEHSILERELTSLTDQKTEIETTQTKQHLIDCITRETHQLIVQTLDAYENLFWKKIQVENNGTVSMVSESNVIQKLESFFRLLIEADLSRLIPTNKVRIHEFMECCNKIRTMRENKHIKQIFAERKSQESQYEVSREIETLIGHDNVTTTTSSTFMSMIKSCLQSDFIQNYTFEIKFVLSIFFLLCSLSDLNFRALICITMGVFFMLLAFNPKSLGIHLLSSWKHGLHRIFSQIEELIKEFRVEVLKKSTHAMREMAKDMTDKFKIDIQTRGPLATAKVMG